MAHTFKSLNITDTKLIISAHFITTQWGFDGYTTGDCEAVKGVMSDHNYTQTPLDTAAAVLAAGLDSDCGHFLTADLMTQVYQNATLAAMADASLVRLFHIQMRLGFFDPRADVPWALVNQSVVNTPEHQQLAKEAADQSLVLLKNTKATLPFSGSQAVKTVAVIGRNANATTNMQGDYFGTAPFLISPFDGISKYAPSSTLAAAFGTKKPKLSDAACACAGLPPQWFFSV